MDFGQDGDLADQDDMYIFGLTFMENYYSVYDMDRNRVGLVEAIKNKLDTI